VEAQLVLFSPAILVPTITDSNKSLLFIGIKGIDVGISQLAMHSIRETCGTTDTLYYYQLFKQFFKGYSTVAHSLLDA
jgi:hypothetical protein